MQLSFREVVAWDLNILLAVQIGIVGIKFSIDSGSSFDFGLGENSGSTRAILAGVPKESSCD